MSLNKVVLFILFGLLILFFVNGCDQNFGLKEGIVYDKVFNRSHTDLVMLPQSMVIGKTVTTILIPHTFYYPDSWCLRIKNLDKKRDIYVKKDIYEKIEIGQTYKCSDQDLFEQPKKEIEEK